MNSEPEYDVPSGDARLYMAEDAGGIAIWEFDISSNDVQWSPSGYRLYGVAPDWKPSYENFLALVHPEDRTRVQQTVERGLSTQQPFDHQFRIMTPDGELRWVVSRAKFFPGRSPDAIRLVGVDIDITSLKMTEQRLRERDDELERLHKAAGFAEYSVDLREDGVCWYSDGYRHIHGLSPQVRQEFREEWLRRVHPEDRARVERELDDGIASGVRTLQLEYRVIRPSDGATRWIEAASEIERDEDGLPLRLIATNRDITEHKEAEESLRRKERHLYALLDTMPQIVAVIRPDGFHEYYNRRWYEFTGLPEGSTDGFAWPEVFHPEDAARLQFAFQRSLDTGEPLETEARMRHRSGNFHWHLCRAMPMRSDDGSIEHWLCTYTDINARKLAEERARLAAARLQLALDASATVGTWVWDIPNDRAVADVQTARLFSLDPELAALGVPASMFFAPVHPEDRPHAERRIASALEIGGEFDLEYRLVLPDGRLRWVSERGRVEHGVNGKPLRAFGVSIDISELKQLQNAHELLAKELLHRIKNTFSLISAIATLAAKGRSDEVQQYALDLRMRLHSLSAALIYMEPRQSHQSDEATPSLMGLLKILTAPFANKDDRRLLFEGDDAPLGSGAASSLALLVHELSTNAAKYGGLSNSTGTITMSGKVEGDVYLLTWCERGGPKLEGKPQRVGFGTSMSARLVSSQLGGAINHTWDVDGLTVFVRVPLSVLSDKAGSDVPSVRKIDSSTSPVAVPAGDRADKLPFFLAGGGAMAARIGAFDWSSTALGPLDSWHPSLRSAVDLILSKNHPMAICWGPQLVHIYNDAALEVFGREHLGGYACDAWAGAWNEMGSEFVFVMTNNSPLWSERRFVPTQRDGQLACTWWTYSLAPIEVANGVGGVLMAFEMSEPPENLPT